MDRVAVARAQVVQQVRSYGREAGGAKAICRWQRVASGNSSAPSRQATSRRGRPRFVMATMRRGRFAFRAAGASPRTAVPLLCEQCEEPTRRRWEWYSGRTMAHPRPRARAAKSLNANARPQRGTGALLLFAIGLAGSVNGVVQTLIGLQRDSRVRTTLGLVCLMAGVLACAVAVARASSAFAAKRQRLARLRAGCCGGCGYRLRGNTSGRCPECGLPIPLEEKELDDDEPDSGD